MLARYYTQVYYPRGEKRVVRYHRNSDHTTHITYGAKAFLSSYLSTYLPTPNYVWVFGGKAEAAEALVGRLTPCTNHTPKYKPTTSSKSRELREAELVGKLTCCHELNESGGSAVRGAQKMRGRESNVSGIAVRGV